MSDEQKPTHVAIPIADFEAMVRILNVLDTGVREALGPRLQMNRIAMIHLAVPESPEPSFGPPDVGGVEHKALGRPMTNGVAAGIE